MRSTRWKRLERHRGHFYNWYDTQSSETAAADLRVDGGQREPCGPSADTAAWSARTPRSEDPGVAILRRVLATHSGSSRILQGKPLRPSLAQFQNASGVCLRVHGRLRSLRRDSALTGWRRPPSEVLASLKAAPESRATWWASALARQCQDALADLILLAPWALLSASQNRLSECGDIDEIPTLRELARLDVACLPAHRTSVRPRGDA